MSYVVIAIFLVSALLSLAGLVGCIPMRERTIYQLYAVSLLAFIASSYYFLQ